INEVIRGSLGSGLPIGIIPLGTGNVLAKEMGVPKDPLSALEYMSAGQAWAIDLCRLDDGRVFACMLSAGIEGAIIRALKQARAGGSMHMSQYLPLGLNALRDANYMMRVTIDDRVFSESASYAIIANTHSFGGPVEIVSRARPDDGHFDALVSSADMRYAYPALMASAMVRQVSRLQGVREKAGTKFLFESADGRDVPYQFDGEFAGILPVAGRVLKQGVTILAKRGNYGE
ncbi:MAG: hypothetical protein KDB07_11720, partial [Planctomycetes bacterium]|nr:hypothetical protein [Planctomycetota bacterium]